MPNIKTGCYHRCCQAKQHPSNDIIDGGSADAHGTDRSAFQSHFQQDPDSAILHDALQDRTEAPCLRPVESGRGLVQKQYPERTGQGTGQLDASTLPGGQIACDLVRDVL